ncbi:MAG: YggS family pyridoxal phosphate-dependent enzyme [Thermoguttaceae bacterium]
MSERLEKIAENLSQIRQRIAAAAARGNRRPEQIKLVAVTKYVNTPETRELVQAGCLDLGESRPQQLWNKADELAALPIRWHLIGHLQRNKVQRTLPYVSMIHSADSLRLIEAIDKASAGLGRRVPILLEINTSGETAKGGFQPYEVESALMELAAFEHVEIAGLMCMAGLEGGFEAARRDFAALRAFRDRIELNCPKNIRLDELSMGMSGDFEAAIEEGATMVRIGSALFEGVLP